MNECSLQRGNLQKESMQVFLGSTENRPWWIWKAKLWSFKVHFTRIFWSRKSPIFLGVYQCKPRFKQTQMWTLGYQCEFNKILMPLKEVQDIDPMNLGSSLGYLPVNMASRTPMASCQANCHFPPRRASCHSPFTVGFCCCHIGFPYLEPSLDFHSPSSRQHRAIVVEQARPGKLTSQEDISV